MIRRGLMVVVILCGAGTAARADDQPYAEYRYLAPLGQIQIATGFVARSDPPAPGAALATHGIFALESDTVRIVTRTERIGPHRVITTLRIDPPVGHGEGGASSVAGLTVVLDGDTLVDAPLASATIAMDRVTIDPGRRFVTIEGHRGIVRFDGFESRRVIDADWLERRASEIEALIRGPTPGR